MSRYTNYAIKNNVFGTLSAPVSSLATTIQLDTGQGARFTADMLATLEHIEGNKVTKREIVLITNVSSDTLTVVRKYAACPSSDDANTQGQTSFSFDASDTINVYIPKEILDLINNGIKFLETQGTDRMRVLEAASGTPLAIDIMPGNFRCADDNIVYAGVTDQLLTDNATNYIMIDGTGTLQISTTDRDTRYTRLAKVTTLSGEITEIQDRRLDTIGGNLGGLAIHPLTEKTTPAPTDELVIADSADSYNNKRITYANLSPATLVRFVTLGENVTAGDGYGACYIGTDGKAYKSNVAGHNYCDGIVIDSGSAGDTVRMVISGFVPCNSLSGTLPTVHLAYTSGTTDTGYGDYIDFANYAQNNYNGNAGFIISVDSKKSGCIPIWRTNISKAGTVRHKLYGVGGIITTNTYSGSGGTATIYYATGIAGQYGNNATYGISGCKLGDVVPGGFLFKPKIVEYFVGLGAFASSNNETDTYQANFDGEKTFSIGYANMSNSDESARIYESLDNTNWELILPIVGGSMTTNNSTVFTGQFRVKKGYYYKARYGTNGQMICGILNNE